MPVQRIPRYILLLGEIRKNTPQSYDDYSKLGEAMEMMFVKKKRGWEKKRNGRKWKLKKTISHNNITTQ